MQAFFQVRVAVSKIGFRGKTKQQSDHEPIVHSWWQVEDAMRSNDASPTSAGVEWI